jgi:hypothetical protein
MSSNSKTTGRYALAGYPLNGTSLDPMNKVLKSMAPSLTKIPLITVDPLTKEYYATFDFEQERFKPLFYLSDRSKMNQLFRTLNDLKVYMSILLVEWIEVGGSLNSFLHKYHVFYPYTRLNGIDNIGIVRKNNTPENIIKSLNNELENLIRSKILEGDFLLFGVSVKDSNKFSVVSLIDEFKISFKEMRHEPKL